MSGKTCGRCLNLKAMAMVVLAAGLLSSPVGAADAFKSSRDVRTEAPVVEGPRTMDSVRRGFLKMFESLESMGEVLPLDPVVLNELAAARQHIETMTDEDWDSLELPTMATVERLGGLVGQLEEIVARRSQGIPPADRSPGLPDAVYPNVRESFDLGEADSGWDVLCSTADRSDPEDFWIAYNVYQTAKLVRDIAGRVCDEIVVVVALGAGGGFNTSLACIVTDIIFGVAEAVFNSIALCDDLIDSAEIEGAYERLAHIHADLEETRSTLITEIDQNETHLLNVLKEVTCKPTPAGLRYRGCDGKDSDCDDPRNYDECDEDQFPPDLEIDPGLSGSCFADGDAARDAILEATRAVDDCQAVTISSPVPSGECLVDTTVTAMDACGNLTMESLQVNLDAEAPQISCDVAVPLIWPANQDMVDVGLTFDASDLCDLGLEVEVIVTSDEPVMEDGGVGQLFPDAQILRDPDGTVQGVRVRAERDSQGDGRVYQIRVATTDSCGNRQHADCLVTVPKDHGTPAIDSGQLHTATHNH